MHHLRPVKVSIVVKVPICKIFWQAVMFWVVDNFLMMKRKKKKKQNPDWNMEVHFHRNKQNEHDGKNQSELEILLSMDEEEIKLRNGNHFAERIWCPSDLSGCCWFCCCPSLHELTVVVTDIVIYKLVIELQVKFSGLRQIHRELGLLIS